MLGGAKFVAPNDKVNIAIVGVGGQGRTNTEAYLREKDAQILRWPTRSNARPDPFYYKG